jgi:putative transposase
MNRAVGRVLVFRKEADFKAFQRLMVEAQQRHLTRILAWCLMKTHWHFVLWPWADGGRLPVHSGPVAARPLVANTGCVCGT